MTAQLPPAGRPDPSPDPSPFTRPGFLTAAGVVLVLIVLAGFLVFTGDDDAPDTAPDAGRAPTSSTAPTTSTDTSAEGECDLPADDQTIPTTAPATSWTLVGTIAAPSSPTAGPATTISATGLRSCYARTPTGALFAAANFLALVNNPDTLTVGVDELAADGPGRDLLLELARTNPTAVLGSGTGFQVAGYTFLSATQDATSISIAVGNTGGLAGVPLTVVWQDGDWKVDLPPDGNVAGSAAPINSLAGYVPWSGA